MTDVAMAPINGVVSPQQQHDPQHSSLGGLPKRKRVDSIDAAMHNGVGESKTNGTSNISSQEQIDDFVTILKRFDTTPSILGRSLSKQADSKEPQAKRAKSDDTNTILARAATNAYSSLDDIVSDIKVASDSLIDQLQLPNGSNRSQHTPLSPRESQLATHITLFIKKAEDLVQRQKTQDEMKSVREEPGKSANMTSFLINGNSPKASTQISTKPGDHKLVLTLYGNAPGAKQLFSSLQETVKMPNGTIKAPQPLREIGLPPGINTTQIVPIDSSGAMDDKKRLQTLGDLFSTSTSSLPFQPPKPLRASPAKGLAIGWSQPSISENARSRNNQSYYSQPISSGQWLEYSGASDLPDPKRKQKERALSLSGVKVSTSEVESAEQESAKLEALFRSAYSSFAPTKDDSAAVVPEGTISKIWWQRVGGKSFERLVNNMENVRLLESDADGMILDPIDDEDEKFKDAVANWDEVIDPSLQESAPATDDKSIEERDVEEVLEGISELLETLNSYQRNRNLALTAVPRSTNVLSGSDASSPSKPTEAEAATYSILKSQLTLMISTLPPYAVAKLNSDQLSDLNISTKIPVLTDVYKGVLEEDEYAARAKVAAMTTAASSRHTPSTSHHRASSSSLYGNQYSSSRPPAPPAQYYAQSQTPIRAPATNMPRPPSTVGPVPYAAPRPLSGTNYRPQQSYGTPTYPHQMPRAAPTQQYSAAPQAYYQTPTAPKYSQPSNAPQTAPQPVRYQPTGPLFPRSQAAPNGIPYGYPNGTPVARQPSPQKPIPYSSHLPPAQQSQQQQQQQQQRPYAPPAQPIPQTYYGNTLPNGSNAPPQQQQQQQQPPKSALGPTGYHTVMTSADQASLMERQRAQLAQQQGVQHQARSAAQAGAINGAARQGQGQGQHVNGGGGGGAGI